MMRWGADGKRKDTRVEGMYARCPRTFVWQALCESQKILCRFVALIFPLLVTSFMSPIAALPLLLCLMTTPTVL